MIDLHCHLLPGIDDGPATMDESLQLAKMAWENGITHAVLTPHIIPGRYDNTLQSISVACKRFREELLRNNIALGIAFAAEIRLDPVIMNMVSTQSVPFLGKDADYDLLLLEFPHNFIPPGSLDLVKWMLKRNIKPVIAHPERNQAVLARYTVLQPFLDAGCLLQITAGSLTGVFGKEPEKLARKILKRGWVSLIASDAHNLHKRRPDIEPGRQVAEKIVGGTESRAMVHDRPANFTRGMFGNDNPEYT
ncbi:MAG TPA: CpsB/CapC family capsule biosynthesis tyrosine phosphatase [Gammaproteobacteria bacterium]|nr:CpsB/CapC family capsule biosynthesis tyrosine phosphatase [Gammaproteobacteria bacterium]